MELQRRTGCTGDRGLIRGAHHFFLEHEADLHAALTRLFERLEPLLAAEHVLRLGKRGEKRRETHAVGLVAARTRGILAFAQRDHIDLAVAEDAFQVGFALPADADGGVLEALIVRGGEAEARQQQRARGRSRAREELTA